MLAELQAKAKRTQEALTKATAKPKTERAPRSSTGPTPQPMLPIIEQVFTLDDADRACPSCGGDLKPMKDQFDESEMIDVVEVSYQLVQNFEGTRETDARPRAQGGDTHSVDATGAPGSERRNPRRDL